MIFETTSIRFVRPVLTMAAALCVASFGTLLGCGSNIDIARTSTTVVTAPGTNTVSGSSPTVETSQNAVFVATSSGKVATGGTWAVTGGNTNGTIGATGTYHAPAQVPTPALVSICYVIGSTPFCASITITAPTTTLPVTVYESQATVTAGLTDAFSAMQGGAPAKGGQWSVEGGALNGSITQSGLYLAPQTVPARPTVSVDYVLAGTTSSLSVTVTKPAPSITTIAPSVLTHLSTPIQVTGTNFQQGSMLTVNSIPVTTTFVDASHLSTTVVLPLPISGELTVAVVNPGSPPMTSAAFDLNATFPSINVLPGTLAGGSVTLTVSGSGFAKGDVVLLGGQPMNTVVASSSQITATGFLTPWSSGSALIEVTASDGVTPTSAVSIPITPTAVSFDVAARFTTQAAFGPRPDLVLHIQQIGLDRFITEQFAQPSVTYSLNHGSHDFVNGAISGNSLLRQRVALALQTFIVGTNEDFGPSSTFLETKLENDASANFRQLLTDIVMDPNIANFLNLAKNNASANPLDQPNQNAAREPMQLFSIGPLLLNDDGSVQTDASGNALPAYTQDTVIAMTRALTGWQEPIQVNSSTTAWGIDFSQPLSPSDLHHDHNSKLLFETVTLPAGQTITKDRDMALDAIFNHPNVPPFISHLLIQQLVTSNPSPEYIRRISRLFEDDGTGTRGNMAAVVRAILLDPEARAGDNTPSSEDGFLQSPLKFQLFAMNALQDLGSDDQVLYTARTLGEAWWDSPTVFYFFSPSNMVPATSIHSPEFMLFNNLSAIQRSQVLWGIVTSKLPGYTNDYKPKSWLFTNFTTVPRMIEALNHLLYHGRMPASEQAAIVNYCAQLQTSNESLVMESAVFLSLNGDSYNVSH